MAKSRIASKIVCSLFAVVTVATAGMVTAGASNYTDTAYSFHLFSNTQIGQTQYTPKREKQDATSVYMKCTNTTHPYNGRVYGYNWYGENRTDCSHGYVYTFYTGTTHYMKNFVYEDGFTYAAIQGSIPDYSASSDIIASGVWSPDSI